MRADGFDDVLESDFCLFDFSASSIHRRLKLSLHRPCGLGFVCHKAEGFAQGVQTARGKADVVSVLCAEQFGQRNGAALFVHLLQLAEKIHDRPLRVFPDIARQFVCRDAKTVQRFLKLFALRRGGLQFGQQCVNGSRGDFRRFPECDEGISQCCRLFCRQSKLFGCTPDAQHRGGDFRLFGRGIVAQHVDGIPKAAHFFQRDAKDIADFCRRFCRLLCRHAECNRHLSGKAGKFRQLAECDP